KRICSRDTALAPTARLGQSGDPLLGSDIDIQKIGRIRKSDYPRVRGILNTLPKPTKQPNGDLYRPVEQRRPIMQCEWTHQYAIPKLRREGILHS
ncbi:uncharacterized protein N7529_001132, partial [Penicillium soppii]|uniref:uncharacterized protein n=1 Tax=Penicillium soppii TaxID=69789 RepID=UPI002548EEFC